MREQSGVVKENLLLLSSQLTSPEVNIDVRDFLCLFGCIWFCGTTA